MPSPAQNQVAASWTKPPQPQAAPIEIEAPDGSIVEFPAGTDDATINRAMRREYGGPDAAPARADGFTIEQQRALALGRARRRREEAGGAVGGVTLNIEGRRVKVDDAFLTMSPDEQNKAVEEIAASIGITPPATAPAARQIMEFRGQEYDFPATATDEHIADFLRGQTGAPSAPRIVDFEGKEYEFPGDATDAEIAGILKRGTSAQPSATTQAFDNGVPVGGNSAVQPSGAMPAGQVAAGTRQSSLAERAPVALKAGAQGVGRGIADTLGLPVDVAAGGLNAILAGADAAGIGNGFRFTDPLGGSENLAGVASSIAEAAGYDPVNVEDLPAALQLGHEINRFATGGLLGSAALGSGPMQRMAQGTRATGNVGASAPAGSVASSRPTVAANVARGLSAPYAGGSMRPVLGDVVAGAGAGAGNAAYDEYVPEEYQGPITRLLATAGGGIGGATALSAGVGGATAFGKTVRNTVAGSADPMAPVNPETGGRYSRSDMDLAARSVQRQSSNPTVAARNIEDAQRDFGQFASPNEMPTTGTIAGDSSLLILEKEARAQRPAAFIPRDRAINSLAEERVDATAPRGADARAFTDTAERRQAGREMVAQRGVDQAQGRLQGAEIARSQQGAEVEGFRGQKPEASAAADRHIVSESLLPMQARKNEAFGAVDPDRTVVRDATPIIEAAAEIRASLGRLNDPNSVLPQNTLARIEGLQNGLAEGENPTITFGELNALRPELAAAATKARQNGDFPLADNIQRLQATINAETARLASEATPAGARAAEATRIYSEEFAPVWNPGPGDEATKFRKTFNVDRTGRTTTPPSQTAGRFLQPGAPEKAESLRRIVETTSNSQAAQAEIRRYVLADAAESGMVDARSGAIRPDALRRWSGQWGASLQAFPAIRREIDDTLRRVEAGERNVGRFAADLRTAETQLSDVRRNKGALGLVLGRDPVNAVANMFGSGDAQRNMAAIVREIGTNGRARDGLKASVRDYLLTRATSANVQRTIDGSRPVDLAKLDEVFKRHEQALAEVYSPREMNALRQAHKLLATQQELKGVGTSGSLVDRQKAANAWRLLEGGLKAKFGVLKGGGILRTIRIFAETLPDSSQAAADIVTQMHFDPELAIHLLGRNVDPKSQEWNSRLNSLLAAGAAAREGTE